MIRIAVIAALVLTAAALPAPAAPPCGNEDDPAKPDSAFAVVISSPAEAAALPTDKPVLARVEPAEGEATTWPAEALRRLRLAPGSEVMRLVVAKGSLAGWTVPGVRFSAVDFTGVSLAGADLRGACFDHGLYDQADFSRARLGGAQFERAELLGTVFDGADLAGARMECFPSLVGEGCAGSGDPKTDALVFRGADLTGADVATPVSVVGGVFDGAVIDRTTLPLDDDALAGLAAARLTSVLLSPPGMRGGKAEPFSADEIARLKQLGGGKLRSVIRDVASEPGFDCAAAKKTPVEETICRWDRLKAFDALMNSAYRHRIAGAADKAAVQAAQTAFLKNRNTCALLKENVRDICVADAYLARLADFGVGAGFRPAGKPEYRADPGALAAAAKDDPLARRLLRAYGRSGNSATLEFKDGSLFLSASAIGGNGHSCSFEAALTWNADKKAWTGGDDTQLSWLILPNALVLASPEKVGRDYCGMRAAWPYVFFAEP